MASTIPALALAAAAGLHLAALPDHAGQGRAVAGFFVATAVFQLTAAWAVGRGGVGVKSRIGIAVGNVVLVALWAWSRLAGLPLGDHASPEAASWLDGLAVATQLIAIAGLCLSRDIAGDRRTAAVPGAALLTIMVLTGAGALQWLPANHASHHDSDHEQEHTDRSAHPTGEDVHATSPSEDDHTGTGEIPDPCPTCEAHPADGNSSHDDTAHTHP